MPLVTTLREGAHPLVFPRDLCVSPMDSKPPQRQAGEQSPGEASGGFTCPNCGRMYKLKSSLRNHEKWECQKDPQFQCPFCVYRAKQKMHIGRHMERMHKEKFYKVEGHKVLSLEEAINHGASAEYN